MKERRTIRPGGRGAVPGEHSVTVRLAIRAVPGAGRSEIVGRMADGRIKIRIAAPAEGGRANQALLAFLAETLGVKPAAVRLLTGASSRDKVVQATAERRELERLGWKEEG